MYFKRKIYDKMLLWKKQSNGETALLIEGARRVGKSTVVQQFAENEYKSFVIIDFANASKAELDLFEDISNIDMFFTRLKLLKSVVLHERDSVIVFDEVQMFPPARQAIKYLVKDGRYDYIETGSLISIHKNVSNIVIPSEEESISMFPMDYEEFKWALGDDSTIDLLRSVLSAKQPLGDNINRKMMRDFRLYMLVGGMPQAVAKYIDTKDLEAVDRVKRNILKLYIEDFQKLDESGKARTVFNAIPGELHKNASRFQYTTVTGNSKKDVVASLIEMMADSKTINVAYHADDPRVGLELSVDRETFKIYLSDTGLFVTLAFWDKDFTENTIYNKLLNDKLDANLGYVYENVVAQMIASSGNKLFYYTWLDDQNHRFEIDFLLSRGSKLCPVEVKSSGYSNHPSLDNFCKKFSERISNRYLVYTKDLRKDQETLLVPIYMVGLL